MTDPRATQGSPQLMEAAPQHKEKMAAGPPDPARPAVGRGLTGLLYDALAYAGGLSQIVYLALLSIVWERRRGARLVNRILLQQVYFTAVQALPLTLFVAIAFGALTMIQASVQLPRFGLRTVEGITGIILFREVAPLVVATIVIARSANAIVVEIGNMRVSGEIRALEILGINLERFIVLPRLLGMVSSVLFLTVSFCAAATWGGFWLGRLSGFLETNFVLSRLTAALDAFLLRNVLLRAFAFGLIIGAVACLHGLRVQLSPTEVPQQATRGVISALALCFTVNFILSLGA